ncbi:MAG: hypothetical protein AAFR61_02685 [Bacteroidota bacterium]
MEEPKAYFSLITAYLNGEMEAEEKAAFEQRIEAEPDLAKAIAAARALAAEQAVGPETEEVAEKQEIAEGDQTESADSSSSESDTVPPPTPTQSNWSRRILIVGAIVVGLFGLKWLFTPPGLQDLYQENFEGLPIPQYSAQESHPLMATYEEALEAYAKEKYKQAVPLFENLLADSAFAQKYADDLNLLLGTALIGSGQARASIPVLEEYELHPQFRHDVRWYEAMAFLQLEETENSLHTLFSIAENPESPYAERAYQLIRQMRF